MDSIDVERSEATRTARIDASGIHYRELNAMIRGLIADGVREIVLDNVMGQRYIGDGLVEKVRIVVNGVPGNDLAAFMDGPEIVVNDNAQDGVGNTMNSGLVVVKGSAGDVLGYGMRGGKIFVRNNVGYRTGIHMKEYRDQIPLIVIGGKAGDFFGEYMAGGIMVVLGSGATENDVVGHYIGTGMHGGTIYIGKKVDHKKLGREVRIFPLDESDLIFLSGVLKEFGERVEVDVSGIDLCSFIKLLPASHRPYGNMYVY